MKKTLLAIAATIAISTSASAIASDNRTQMEEVLSGIPGVLAAKFIQDVSLWVFMTDKAHKFDSIGSMICNGGKSKFGVEKGYSITFWNTNKKQLGKFRCYN